MKNISYEINFTTLYKIFLAGLSVISASLSYGALPPNPLDTVYTLTGEETFAQNADYTITNTGKLIIGSDTESGVLNMSYDEKKLLFSNAGTLNIGMGTQSGRLNIVGNYTGALDYVQLLNSTGTLNLGKNGTLSISGKGFGSWQNYANFETANISGTFDFSVSGNSYLTFKNMNFYEGSISLNGGASLYIKSSGTWNIYSRGIVANLMRAGGSGNNLVLHCEDAISNIGTITTDYGSSTLKITTGEYSQYIRTLSFNDNSTITLSLANDKELNGLIIKTLKQKDTNKNGKANLSFENFANDYVQIEDISTFEIVDNKIYIAEYNMYITINAFDSEGKLIEGNWYFEENPLNGMNYLNNTGFIPEPATFALLFALLGLTLVSFQRKNQ